MNDYYARILKRSTEEERARAAKENVDIDTQVSMLREEIERIRREYCSFATPLINQIVKLESMRRSIVVDLPSRIECIRCGADGPQVDFPESRIDGWLCENCYKAVRKAEGT